jgi:hypothetical protein
MSSRQRYDMSTVKIAWQDEFGGEKLWGSQTVAGANATATVFESEREEIVGK